MSIGFKIEDGVMLKYEGTDSVVVIPEGVEKIGEKAFYGNKTITEVTMPDSVRSIEKDAFEECIKLGSDAKSACNWITTRLLGEINKSDEITIDNIYIRPNMINELIKLSFRRQWKFSHF